MWADTESDVDFLNYTEVAELASEMISTPSLLPLSLGIFGTWGTGKSSILKLIRADLLRQGEWPDGEPGPTKHLVVEFDAWLYQGFDDAKAALMAVIAKALFDEVPESMREKAAGLFKRVNKLKLLGLIAEGGAAALGVPTFGMLSRGLNAAEDHLGSGAHKPDDDKAVQGAIDDARKRTDGLLAAKKERTAPEEIGAFRREFAEVLDGLGKTLVVFIDNLDRCSPPATIHTLEAVRLFLFLPNTAFVVAADEDMIRHAVVQHFRNPSDRHVADYLDKLIQIPIRVPKVGVQEVRAYLFMLFATAADLGPDQVAKIGALRAFLIDKLRQTWRRDSGFAVGQAVDLLGARDDDHLVAAFELADRIAPLLAYSGNVNGNPRIIKRLLNVIRMRRSVARRRGIPLDEAVIAKLALFERCVDSASTEALHNAINLSDDGSPGFLARLEAADKDDEEGDAGLPEPWKNHLAFVRDWSRLQPPLAGIDLKPAVYLAKESVPLRLVSSALSSAATKAMHALCETATVQSPAARQAIASVPSGEHGLLMHALIAEMRRSPDWGRPRGDFRGALVLAEVSPSTAEALGRFIRTLDLPKLPRWLSAMIKDRAWT